MNISSLNALSNNNICFDKWDRSNSFVAQCMRKFSGKNIPINYILAVKEQELITVSCKELTCWNFLLKFLGLGPLAKMDLHLAEVSKLLNKNWQVIQAEIATSASLSEDLAKTKQRQTILKNIEQSTLGTESEDDFGNLFYEKFRSDFASNPLLRYHIQIEF